MQTKYLYAGATVVGTALGFAVGYAVANQRLIKHYTAVAEREVRDSKLFYEDYYARLNKSGPYATPETAASELIVEATEALDEYRGNGKPRVPYNKIDPDNVKVHDVSMVTDPPNPHTSVEIVETTMEQTETEQPIVKNVWDDLPVYPPGINVEERTAEVPYLLMEQEYLANDPEHTQTELTYFIEDSVLVDETQTPIDINSSIGTHNVGSFGIGVESPHVMFIRNEKSKMDYEVLRSTGSYAHEVAGLEHSDSNFEPMRRTRRRDNG